MRDLRGFAETGEEGRERQDRLLALVRAHGARLVGPNCLGSPSRVADSTRPSPRAPLPAGRIGFSSQSGALGLALLEKAAERALGFSSFVSIGNKADVSSNDLLEWWEDDEATDLVLLYLESFGNPRTFARVARRVARRKPILALEGRLDLGRLARRELAYRSACKLRRRRRRALPPGRRPAGTNARGTRSTPPRCSRPSRCPRGRRVGVITNAGGLGILCADACESAGLELPELTEQTTALRSRPPLPARRAWATRSICSGQQPRRPTTPWFRTVLADPNVDALIVIFVPPVVAGADEVAAAIRRAVEPSERDKARRRGRDQRRRRARRVLSEPGSPVVALPYPESAARALALAAARADWLARAAGNGARLDGRRRYRDAGSSTRRLRNHRTAWLAAAPDPHAARGIRHPARRRTSRAHRRRRRGRSPRARLPGRRQDGRARGAQDRVSAASPSTCATPTRSAPQSSGSACP